tara:strand:- start:145 stop:1602 length:1458 start_codon:yes stop_codon:yes gene_type:complete
VIQEKENFPLKNWEIVSVNPSQKNWTWKDLFCFWGSGIQSIVGFSLIASIYLIYNLNFLIVLIGCVVSSILVYLFCNLIGQPSQKHGLPFPVILRSSMGINGARYIALLRGAVGIFMFGVQTFFISKSIGYLIRILIFNIDENILDQEIFFTFYMSLNIIDYVALILSLAIQYIFFSKGISRNKSFINFSAFFVYFGLIIFLIMIVAENYNELSKSIKIVLNVENVVSKSNILPLLTVIGTMFAYLSMVILNFGDFSRYVKNESELKKGNLSLILNLLLFSIFSVLLVLGSDIILVKNMIAAEQLLTNPTDIIGKFDNTFLTVFALIFIFFASLSTNLIANYIPSQNVLINFLPNSFSLKSAGIFIVITSFFISMFWLPVLSQIGILSFVDTVGAFFGPIFGIIIADFYLIQKKTINNKDIFSSISSSSYYYTNGWHLKALSALLVGFIFSASTIWNSNLIFLQPYSWMIGAFVSWLSYYLLVSK